MKILDSQPPFDNSDLLAFEQEIGATLPTDYRNFLKRYNGGKPSLSVFKWGEQAYSDSSVRHFFSLSNATDASLRRIRSVYQRSDFRVSLDVLPIAADDGGNLVCIGIQGERHGKVYFWDHEQEGENNSASASVDLQLVSENFKDFLKSLKNSYNPKLDPLYFLDTKDYEGLRELVHKTLGTEYIIPYQDMTLLEYSCRYRNPELTELMLSLGATVTDKALEIARGPMGNARSLELVEQAAQSMRER